MQREQKGIISNPNLAPYIKQSILAYQEAGMLEKFYTTFCISHRWTAIVNLLPHQWGIFLNRRSFCELYPEKLQVNGWMEILRVLTNKFGSAKLADQVWEWSEKRFDRAVSKQITAETVFFHGYEHACLSSLKTAKALGVITFYEQPSQHHQYFTEIVERQIQKYPDLNSVTIALLNDYKAQQRNQRRDEELALSDFVICNSTFTKNTLLKAGLKPAKLIVIPYGYPEIRPIPAKDPKIFKFIYAGNLSLRKGIHLLLAVWRSMPSDESFSLTLMGSNQLPAKLLENLPSNVKWIPNLPYEVAQQKIAESDVLVLPTLADGFGMVISESMALGVPVLTTDASAGPDLIKDYQDGIIIPSDDMDALKEALLWCTKHRDECIKMGEKAQKKAKAYPWSAYRQKLVAEVKNRIDSED